MSPSAFAHQATRPILPDQPRGHLRVASRSLVQFTLRKGLTTFLDAAAQIARRNPDVNFLIIGRGQDAYVESVRRHAVSLGIADAVHFLGWRADVPALLCKCDVLVIASEQEPFGLTAVEAMALGVPVVATRSGGPEEIIEHGRTGHLVPTNSPESIAQAVTSLLANDELHRAISEAGKASVAAKFSLEAYVGGVEETILQAAACGYHPS